MQVTKQVGTLGKAAFNPHGQYKYVSIDKYYEQVGAAAADAGLSWILIQDKFEIHPSVGKQGMISVGYKITVFHEDGDVIPDFSYTSIIHPIQGAQTVGSAMSYADKVFQRQLFKIATGEEDADSTDAKDLADLKSLAPKEFPLGSELEATFKASKPEVNTDLLETTILSFLPDCPDLVALTKFFKENRAAVDTLQKHNPEKHKALLAAFKARKDELTTTQGK